MALEFPKTAQEIMALFGKSQGDAAIKIASEALARHMEEFLAGSQSRVGSVDSLLVENGQFTSSAEERIHNFLRIPPERKYAGVITTLAHELCTWTEKYSSEAAAYGMYAQGNNIYQHSRTINMHKPRISPQ